MQFNVPVAGTNGGTSITIDGVTYETLKTDNAGDLMVAVRTITALTDVVTGQTTVAVANTPVQLSNVPCTAISIAALDANAGPVYIGAAGVTTATGRELVKDASIDLSIDNANRFYVVGAGVGDGVSWLTLN